MGFKEGGDYTFANDEIFFYDDPHQLFQHWGPKVWQAIDAHQVILGMNERQVNLSLGQVSKSLSKDYGNRMVVFDNLGKPMAVTFVKNQVTSFRPVPASTDGPAAATVGGRSQQQQIRGSAS